MKVEGEQGRGSVKVPFITATRALPPRLLAAVLGIVMMFAAAPLWRLEAVMRVLIYISGSVSGMKVRSGGTNGYMSKTVFLVKTCKSLFI